MQTETDVTVSAALLLALGLAHFAQEENDSSQAAVSPVLFTSILKYFKYLKIQELNLNSILNLKRGQFYYLRLVFHRISN